MPIASGERAPQRGKTRGEWLKFAVEFSQLTLDEISQSEANWLQAGLAEIIAFGLSPEPKRTRVSRKGKEHALRLEPGIYALQADFPLGREALCQLQNEVKRILRAVAFPVTETKEGTRSYPLTFFSLQLQVGVAGIDMYTTSPGNTLYIKGALRDVFLFVLQMMFLVEPPGCIQTCPECGRLFYRVTKQKYCSTRCTNTVALRHYRSDPEKKQKEAERAAERYAARITKNGTTNARPQRRRRHRGTTTQIKEHNDGTTGQS